MVIGAHLRNEIELQGMDYVRVQAMEAGGVVLMHYHNPEEVALLGLSPSNCVVRLPDSVEGGTVRTLDEYIDACTLTIRRFYPYGYRRFQIDNEPDLSWRGYVPPQGQTVPQVWAWFTRQAFFEMGGVARRVERDTIFGLTPMSNPKLNGDWLTACHASIVESPIPTRGLSIVDMCGFACAHCYWQFPRYMGWDDFGAGYRYVQRRTGKQVLITECGNSLCQLTPTPSRADITMAMSRDYPEYASQVIRDGVLGAYFFILGGTPEWAGLDITMETCALIGDVVRRHGTGGKTSRTVL